MATNSFSALRINPDRFLADFQDLARIGATGDGGVHRPALSKAHLASREWFLNQIQAGGLESRIDGAGNHSAHLDCGSPGAPTLLLGSHLDSVPYGGRFDGALGVLAALEVLRVVKEADLKLSTHLEAIDFTDEEGAYVGLMGSSAVAGKLQKPDLNNARGGHLSFKNALREAGMDEENIVDAARPPESLAGYLELHIEQGNRLAKAKADIGIVTSIVGLGSYWLSYKGEAAHAGTASMTDRRDASLPASSFTLAVRRVVTERYPGCVATVGTMRFEPGAYNIVPGRAVLSVEFRAPQAETLRELEKDLLDMASSEAKRFGLELDIEPAGTYLPAQMSSLAHQMILKASRSLNLRSIPLASMAIHDAQPLADCCPAGMIFVPSGDGISHSPLENTAWKDCVNGANVLLQSALRLGTKFGV